MRKNPEQCMQAELFQWARSCEIDDIRYLLHSTLNGAHLAGGAIQWGILKRTGAKEGIPDILLPIRNEEFTCLWIELKSPGTGHLSTCQKKAHGQLRARGHRVVVCWSAAEAKQEILNYLNHINK